jgi:hypothetical protein
MYFRLSRAVTSFFGFAAAESSLGAAVFLVLLTGEAFLAPGPVFLAGTVDFFAKGILPFEEVDPEDRLPPFFVFITSRIRKQR